jgi:hypothetical protein
MRTARVKPKGGTYYHIVNRVAGEPGWFPFGDVERQKFVELVKKFSNLFAVEVLAYQAMGNHYHILCHVPVGRLSVAEAVARHNAFYEGIKDPIDPESQDAATLPDRLRDVSGFVGLIQQCFAVWFNRTRPNVRRGGLWASRFKSVIIEGGDVLLTCLCYVELNCVRAGLATDPADYRFGSWGAWAGTGCHPFWENFFRHIRLCLGVPAQGWTDNDIRDFLRAELARRRASDNPLASPQSIAAAVAEAKCPVGLLMTTERRCRYWADGLIIGSKTFVLETAAAFRSADELTRHRLLVLRSSEDARCYAYRRVREVVI